MSLTTEGALKIAAGKVGVSPGRYRQLSAAGFKWCIACRSWKKSDAFGADSTRWDKKSSRCLPCHRQYCRSRYRPKAPRVKLPIEIRPNKGSPSGRRKQDPREGDKAQAHARVTLLVKTGRMPHANDLLCSSCGHLYEPGQKRHEYHHHKGYGAECHEDVVPLCVPCHGLTRRKD